jgi:hypothetical protein
MELKARKIDALDALIGEDITNEVIMLNTVHSNKQRKVVNMKLKAVNEVDQAINAADNLIADAVAHAKAVLPDDNQLAWIDRNLFNQRPSAIKQKQVQKRRHAEDREPFAWIGDFLGMEAGDDRLR